MKRIISVLTVMAIVAAMLVANALPAFAAANEDKSSCRGDIVSDTVTDPLNPGGPYTGQFGFGKGTSIAANQFHDDGNPYGQDWITNQAHGTFDFCAFV
jgi:hypothetical protein